MRPQPQSTPTKLSNDSILIHPDNCRKKNFWAAAMPIIPCTGALRHKHPAGSIATNDRGCNSSLGLHETRGMVAPPILTSWVQFVFHHTANNRCLAATTPAAPNSHRADYTRCANFRVLTTSAPNRPETAS